MEFSRGTTCQVSAFYLEEPPSDGVGPPQSWMAVATAHVYDDKANGGGVLTPEAAVLAGEVMRVISAKVSAQNEHAAVMGAVKALMDTLDGMGFSRMRQRQ